MDEESRVLVKTGPNSESYHRDSGDGTPACTCVGSDDLDAWSEWSWAKADAWKDPCGNPECYGEGVDDKKGWNNRATQAISYPH